MFKNKYTDYFYTKDHTRIFNTTNFQKREYNDKKPLLVFNYGLVCNNAHWKLQIPYFDELGYQILIHDYRCHYSSSGAEDGVENCTFKNMCEDIHQLLESFQAKKVYMLGHSMGVNVSLEYANSHPENLKGIILISGTVIPPQDVMFDTNVMDILNPYIEKFTTMFPELYKKIWKTSFMNPIARIAIHQGGFNVAKVPEEFIHVYMKRIGELPADIFFKLFKEMHDHDIINHLESIKCPSLVMGGDLDKIIPNYLQNILHKYLTNSELYIVKDGSHVPQADFPDSINHRILRFIQKHN
jgi:non-heme chloroperoxidase